jgi:hypothetical protein
MFKMELQWKEVSLDLEKVDTKLKADYPSNYKGNQAHSVLELWFENEPSELEKADILAYWEALDEESDEASSYRSQADVKEAQEALKAGLIAKSWDQMSAVERKAMMGMSVTKQELIDAELL